MRIRIPSSRPGNSLLELLVVIAIIGILLGLLLSAVQKVRATADRIRCGNNLRQIALASHMFHDSHERFPSGFTRNQRYPGLNWLVRLLPHLEQSAAWQQVEADFASDPNPFRIAPQHQMMDRPVAIFGCPADWRTGTAWTVKKSDAPLRIALTSYLGNNGSAGGRRNGVIYRGSRVNFAHITDGASNTILAVEHPPNFNLVYGWMYTGIGQDGAGSLDSVMAARERNTSIYPSSRACGAGPFPFGPGRVDDPCSTFHHWSLHSGGTHFAFCDGSVRFLNYSADSVLPQLATRNGGEVAVVPD